MIALVAVALAASRPAPLPEPLPAAPYAPPEAIHRTLSNGMPVVIVPSREVPLFDVRLVTKVGDPSDPVAGATATLMDLVDEGAGERDAAALAGALRALGAEVSASSLGDGAMIRVRGLSRNLEPALALWRDVVREPRLSQADLDIVRGRKVQQIEVQLKRPDGLAGRAEARLRWGEDYLGRSPTVASLQQLTPETMRAQHARIGPNNSAIVAGGDVDPDALVAALERLLGDWKGGDRVAHAPKPRQDVAGKLYVIDVPGATQSAVRAFTPVGDPQAPDRYPLEVAVEGLGGAFTSRINLNLREDKGWTYGSSCGIAYRTGPGILSCGALVRADVTAGAVAELRNELEGIVGERPISADETEAFRGSLLNSWRSDHETAAAHLADWTGLWLRDRPDDWIARWLQQIGQVTPQTADAAVRSALDPKRVTWLVVGDLAKVRKDLEALGLPVVELEPE